MNYAAFLDQKQHSASRGGFAPRWMPDFLFDFQRALVTWAVETGRAAIFADCGMGKTPMQLVWAHNIIEHTNGRVLILTPLAVGAQTLQEAERFNVPDVARSRDGELGQARIVVTNYEQLDKFSPTDFQGVVCDESSILKHYTGATQKSVTRFLAKVPYRLLCTATAAPNDWSELGTSSEALGALSYTDMLQRFFTQAEQKPHRMEEVKNSRNPNHYAKLAFRVSQQIGLWRLKGHAEDPFWRWVSSWARACRKPSDLGFPDERFILPPLSECTHVIMATKPRDGMLFTVPAIGFHEEREERRLTMRERCEAVAALVAHDRPALVFCQLNTEGDLLTKLISGAVQVSGADTDEEKESRFLAFVRGDARVLVTKSKIAGFGLNFQHCAHVVTFVTHSYEGYYQSVRRCWRFGQTSPVTVDIIATEGEQRVSENLQRKAAQADAMFARLVQHMYHAEHITATRAVASSIEVPSWLASPSSPMPTRSTAAIA